MTYTASQGIPIDIDHPGAMGVCDYSGFWFKRTDLLKQMEWRGNSLAWTGFLVFRDYLEKPNEQLRNPVLQPDPVPIRDPRPPQGSQANAFDFYVNPNAKQQAQVFNFHLNEGFN